MPVKLTKGVPHNIINQLSFQTNHRLEEPLKKMKSVEIQSQVCQGWPKKAQNSSMQRSMTDYCPNVLFVQYALHIRTYGGPALYGELEGESSGLHILVTAYIDSLHSAELRTFSQRFPRSREGEYTLLQELKEQREIPTELTRDADHNLRVAPG
jgi:hypothetical protein